MIYECAYSNALIKSSSEISFELPSTIIIASSVPATIISISDSSNWLMVGLTINSPLILPTKTSEYGPPNGISEITKAADAPTAASVSASISGSDEYTEATIWVSFCQPFGKRGLAGRSINRADSTSFSLGLPSLLKNPPGILPAAAVFSRYSTVKGKKSKSVLGS